MDTDPHRRITASRVRELCGGVSNMTLWRLLHDPEKDFPRPTKVGQLRLWREAEVVEWLDSLDRC